MNDLYERIGEIFGDVYSPAAIRARAEEDERMLAAMRQQAKDKRA